MFNQYFGNYLLEKNFLKPEQLKFILSEQKSVRVKLGILAIDAGFMTAEQVERVHKLQAERDRKFGELAIDEGYLTDTQVDALLAQQKKSNIILGQVIIDKGYFTYEKYENVLLQYRKDSGFTADEIETLKSNDMDQIAQIFLKSLPDEQKELINDYFELFIRNVIRFIDNEVRIDRPAEAVVCPYDYLVTQKIVGDYTLFSGFAAQGDVLAKVASNFAAIDTGEAFEGVNDLTKDALMEFLNCHNGLFLSHLSDKGIESDLAPGEVKERGCLEPHGALFVIPLHLSFGRLDFVFSDTYPSIS